MFHLCHDVEYSMDQNINRNRFGHFVLFQKLKIQMEMEIESNMMKDSEDFVEEKDIESNKCEDSDCDDEDCNCQDEMVFSFHKLQEVYQMKIKEGPKEDAVINIRA